MEGVKFSNDELYTLLDKENLSDIIMKSIHPAKTLSCSSIETAHNKIEYYYTGYDEAMKIVKEISKKMKFLLHDFSVKNITKYRLTINLEEGYYSYHTGYEQTRFSNTDVYSMINSPLKFLLAPNMIMSRWYNSYQKPNMYLYDLHKNNGICLGEEFITIKYSYEKERIFIPKENFIFFSPKDNLAYLMIYLYNFTTLSTDKQYNKEINNIPVIYRTKHSKCFSEGSIKIFSHGLSNASSFDNFDPRDNETNLIKKSVRKSFRDAHMSFNFIVQLRTYRNDLIGNIIVRTVHGHKMDIINKEGIEICFIGKININYKEVRIDKGVFNFDDMTKSSYKTCIDIFNYLLLPLIDRMDKFASLGMLTVGAKSYKKCQIYYKKILYHNIINDKQKVIQFSKSLDSYKRKIHKNIHLFIRRVNSNLEYKIPMEIWIKIFWNLYVDL